MPDILIHGMRKPTSCDDCPMYTCMHNFDDCPLVELPPHGDLILRDDAIVAVKLLSDLYPEYRKILAVLWDQIKDLTVIIPASEEEKT